MFNNGESFLSLSIRTTGEQFMKIIVPKLCLDEDRFCNVPLFYLAGPNGIWHKKAIGLINDRWPQSVVAVPCNYRVKWSYFPLIVETEKEFNNNYEWKNHFSKIARNCGCIIYWLPLRDQAVDQPNYAELVDREIKELLGSGSLALCPPIVVGIEGELGKSKIFSSKHYSVKSTLEGTIECVSRVMNINRINRSNVQSTYC